MFSEVSKKLACQEAAIRAVVEVESAGSGRLNDGRLKILFEAHVFSRQTKHRYDFGYPHISSHNWNRALYVGGPGEYLRLEQAAKLNEEAAYRSVSYGKFQILGENYAACGYKSAKEFFNAIQDEATELQAFCNFIASNQEMHRALQRCAWAEFASRYNGPGYAKNGYDKKLASAYAKFSKQVKP